MDLTPLEKDGIEPAQPLQKKEKDFIMQPNYSVSLPHYSVGPEAYSLVGDIIRPYGTRVAVVGGETAMTKANPSLLPALEAAGLTVTDVHVYGHDSTVANVEAIKARSGVRNADVILAVGGGRCCDAVKTAADMMGKSVMTCPTVAMDSPEPLFWAGLGDALSKQIEVLYCTRGKHLFHTPLLGAQLACACQEPLLQFGRQALDDFRAKTMSDAFTECVLDIIVSTGVVSNLVTHTEYYYNSSLAHCFYNASMVLPSAHAHLHGEVVSFGNLVLLAYDGQDELLERFLDFNTSIGLPVTLAQVGITTDEQLMKLVSAAEHIKEWSTGPEPAVREQFVAAIRKVDTLGAARLAAAA